MQRVRTHGAVMAGAALTAMALSLAACSSSSSSSGRRLLVEQPQRHAERERVDAAACLSAGGHPGLQVDPAQHDRQLRRRRLGQGAHGPGLGGRPVRGLGLADPLRRGGELQGQDGALLPHPDQPDHGLVQPVGRHRPEADGARHRGHLPGQDHEVERPGDHGAQPRRQAAQHRRSPSPTARTPRAPRPTSPSSSWRARRASGSSAAARPSPGPPPAGAATATAGWRRSSSPPPAPSGTWTTPTPRPPG